MRGACYVVYGQKAQSEAEASMETLWQHHPDLPVVAVTDRQLRGAVIHILRERGDRLGRLAKLNLDGISPWPWMLYIDADTRVRGSLDAGWDILADGWDIAMAYSERQGGDLLWHVGAEDKAATLEAHPLPLGLQAGLLFVSWNERTRALWQAWREEWARYRDQDQGALIRALMRVPVRVWLLGRAWNGGELVEHRFGAARAEATGGRP